MAEHASGAAVSDADDSFAAAPALRLLPPGATIPARYRHLAAQLQDWDLPADLVQTGLLLRFIERGAVAVEAIAEVLGAEAAAIAHALGAAAAARPRPALQPLEPVWKLFLLSYLHPSASLLKIAELLMHLRHSQDADITASSDLIHAAAHVCTRLGMWDLRTELLNIQVRLADPHLARRARALLDHSRPARLGFFVALERDLTALLRNQGIAARIKRRPRHIFNVIEAGLERVQGVFPSADVVLVLIETVEECYRALGALNNAFPVVGARLGDYIGGPKENGYQALHTAIEFTAATPDGERAAPVEIRIMTPAMDHFNHAGYLAYLTGAPGPARRPPWWCDRTRWLAAYQGQSHELFVFTPRGEAIFLPLGATVLDFAVRVHSNLGVYCRGAQVNGCRTLPGAALASGDICEVLIEPYGDPIDPRLLEMARTSAARASIRRALQHDKTGAARGRQIFHEVLTRSLAEQEVHASEATIDQQVAAICRARNYAGVEAFYRAVARGEAAPDQVVRAIVSNLLLPRLDLTAIPGAVRSEARRLRLALCCKPRPSLPAVAVPIHSGHELKIHSAGCPNVAAADAYPVQWRPGGERAYVADAVYESWDRPGLIHQVTGALTAIGAINIRAFRAEVPEPSLARISFSFEAPNPEQIEQVRQTLERLPERRNVELRAVTLIDDGMRIITPLDNPYGPQPVGRWPLFVGRDAEVRRILAQLDGRNGGNHILVRGPRRIGKSSLLHHLSRYHLLHFKVPALLDLQSLPTDELRLPNLLGRIAALLTEKARLRTAPPRLDPQAVAADPIRAFGAFLAALHDAGDGDRFVMLIDEFGVVFSRLQGGPLTAEFFDQWRALLNNPEIARHLSFIIALPDNILAQIDAGEPTGRIGELGRPIRLTVLDPGDARDLIATPIHTHLAYDPADLDLLVRETGGHPYYIHLVCAQIVNAIQVQQRKTGARRHERQVIPAALVREALAQVGQHDDAFYHTLADSSPATVTVLRAVAALTGASAGEVKHSRLRAHLKRSGAPEPAAQIERALAERPDLLGATDQAIALRVALVTRWLRRQG